MHAIDNDASQADTRAMRRNLPLEVFFLVLVLAASIAMLQSSVRPTEAKCPPPRPNQLSNNQPVPDWFDGWNRGASGMSGVSSYIWNYSPWVAPVTPPPGGNSKSWVTAWTMLYLRNFSNPMDQNYAQVGWYEEAYDVRRTFLQYTTYVGSIKTTKTRYIPPGQPVGTWSEYKMQLNYSTSYFEFWVAGSKIWQTAATFVPTDAQVSAEMSTFANQMPGGYNNNEWFALTQFQQNGGGAWQNFNGQQGTDPDGNWFGYYPVPPSNSNLAIWDNACAQ